MADEPAGPQQPPISLAGQWQFAIAEPKPDAEPGALPAIAFRDTITLPGTTDTREKGPENSERWTGGLTRLHKFVGPAWYQRAVAIPPLAAGQRVTLVLERTKFTQVWLDGRPCGSSPILCTPQEYELGAVEPGEHTLTIMVDNSRRPVNAEMHQMSENTQGNWNGILGRIELQLTPTVWLDDLQVDPDLANDSVRVRVAIGNRTGQPGHGSLTMEVDSGLEGRKLVQQMPVTWTASGGRAEVAIPLAPATRRWEEFDPFLFTLTARLDSPQGTQARSTRFGLREFRTQGSQFTINGRPTFLRGKHDACVFPLTGHPPMDVAGWSAYFRVLKDLGINHVRFHTWTPPEAAFAAADELGLYLQPELPFWGPFTDEVRQALQPEAERIVRVYGNHPSFVMLSLGNECGGSRAVMASLVADLRALDPRHLYAQGSNNELGTRPLAAGDDYWTTVRVSTVEHPALSNVRGSFATVDGGNGHVQVGPADTLHDYSAAIAGIPVPVVGHEVGQYTTYPDFAEIAKYTGVFRARNLEQFRQKLAEAGMLDQAPDFVRATTRLAQICYREDVEAALRTPGFGGFQLLDLQDFPGQGTALVGLLNAFLEPKPGFEADRWKGYCAPIVPLLRFPRYAWTTGETFSAEVQVAHYGPNDLGPDALEWTVVDTAGEPVARGLIPFDRISQGGVRPLGTVTFPLGGVKAPQRLEVRLRLPRGPAENRYALWVYPAQVETAPPPGVTLARAFDADARKVLADGGRVVLIPESGKLVDTVGGGFTTDFWCWPMFHNRPGTMGLICDPRHPALAAFPTDFHSDWQWFPLVLASQPVILDAAPSDYRPLVQVIDNLERVHKLGLVFEARVGPGRLLVCATDLVRIEYRLEARQLLHSLLAYAGSDDFQPDHELPVPMLAAALATALPVAKATTSSVQGEHGPNAAFDGNPETRWCASGPEPDQWLQVDLGVPRMIRGCRIAWESDKPGYAYILEASDDGSAWSLLSDQRENRAPSSHRLDIPPSRARHVRLTIKGLPRGQWASIRELQLIEAE